MLPRDRAYGLATAARVGRHGRGGRVRVYSRTYGLAKAARDERPGRECSRAYSLVTAARYTGGRDEHGRAGARSSKQSVGWAAAATAGRPPPPAGQPPAAAGRPPATGAQLVVYERENGDYILYKER